MVLLLMLWVFIRERVCYFVWSFVYILLSLHVFICAGSVGFLGDAWFPVLTPAMSARNQKRRKLLRTLRRHGVTGAGLPGRSSFFASFSWFVSSVVSHKSVHVDLGFKDGLPAELPADWTGFPAEVVDNLKGTDC